MTDQIPSCCWNRGLLFAAEVGIWSLTAQVEELVSHCFGAVGVSVPNWKTSLLSVLSGGVPKRMTQDLASHYCSLLSVTATRGSFLSEMVTGNISFPLRKRERTHSKCWSCRSGWVDVPIVF